MNTYGTIIGILTSALGYNDGAASAFGATFIVGGIIGSACFGVIVELKKNYRVVTIVICGLSSLTPFLQMIALNTNIISISSFSCFLTGFSMVSILPVGIDFGVELTHPTPEPVISGLLVSSGAIIGIILTILSSATISYY